MKYYPVFMDLQHQRVLVIGGGEVAARKVNLLQRAGAALTLVAPQLDDELAALRDEGALTHVARNFVDGDIEGARLVVAASDDNALHHHISQLCQSRGIPVNVVDDTPLCSVITPAMVDRSPLQIAISSGGVAPILARRLRAWIEAAVPPSYGRLAELAERFREAVKEKLATGDQRRRFWERVLEGPVASLVHAGRDDQAEAALAREIEGARGDQPLAGEVALVGAGPGDPDLLTFRALRLMQEADVVLYDRLVAPAVLDLCRRDAERIYVGKRRSAHHMRQEHINAEMIRLAGEGRRVVRLKGGDPFIFGRGGEELGELMEAGIPFQVVPGITAASGAAAYAGIPLTHRDYAHSVQFVTGHLSDGELDLDWTALAREQQTLVIYMGLAALNRLCARLIEHGCDPHTPAALVQQATTDDQRVFVASLATLPVLIARHDVHAPTLIIVGDVVRLHRKLQWFRPQNKVEDAQPSAAGSVEVAAPGARDI